MSIQSIAPIKLPQLSYHPDNDDFALPEYRGANQYDDICTISQVEQLIRAYGVENQIVDTQVKYIDKGVQEIINYQSQQDTNPLLFETHQLPDDKINHIKDPWLQQKGQELIDRVNGILQDEKDLLKRREDWYDSIYDELWSRGKKAIENHRSSKYTFKPVICPLTEESRETIPQQIWDKFDIYDVSIRSTPDLVDYYHDYWDNDVNDRSWFITPAIYQGNTLKYIFLPNCGVLSCTCGDKHQNPTSTLCKHELQAFIQQNQDGFTFDDSLPDYYPMQPEFQQLSHINAHQDLP